MTEKTRYGTGVSISVLACALSTFTFGLSSLGLAQNAEDADREREQPVAEGGQPVGEGEQLEAIREGEVAEELEGISSRGFQRVKGVVGFGKDDVTSKPREYVGDFVVVHGSVDQISADNIYRINIEKSDWDGLYVVNGTGHPLPLKLGEAVTIGGRLYEFSRDQFADQYNLEWDKKIENALRNKVVMAGAFVYVTSP